MNSIKFFSKAFNYVLLSISTCLLIPTNEALARPGMFTSAYSISLSPEECKAKAIEVANFVLTKSDINENQEGEIFHIFGNTSSSRASIYCIGRTQDTYFVVVTSSNYSRNDSEANSLRKRITKFMQS